MVSVQMSGTLKNVLKKFRTYSTSLLIRRKIQNICYGDTDIVNHREGVQSFSPRNNLCQLRLMRHRSEVPAISGSVLQPFRCYSTTSDSEDDLDTVLDDPQYDDYIREHYILPEGGHRVLVIQPDIKWGPKKPKLTNSDLQLAEGCALIRTLPRWRVVDKLVMSLKMEDKKRVFGTGNFATLTTMIRSKKNITAVFMNKNMLTRLQLTTLQSAWKLAVYDRYTIVLQIFKVHARTKEAKLQVALAELPYFKSRLHGMHDGTLEWQHEDMARIGGMGESYIQLRQQILQERERKIKKALLKLRSKRQLLREGRLKKDIPIIAIVGYTNSGKTSLIKALTGETEMEPKDQLFATLDITAHAGLLRSRLKVLYLDTVGFISDIPTDLIEAFAATLEDVLHADVVVHIRDISHPDTISQRAEVVRTLSGLNLPSNILNNMIEVCNKADLLKTDVDTSSEHLADDTLFISATEGTGLLELKTQIEKAVLDSTDRQIKKLRIPMNGQHLSWLYKEATVCSSKASEDGEHLFVECIMNKSSYARFKATFIRKKS